LLPSASSRGPRFAGFLGAASDGPERASPPPRPLQRLQGLAPLRRAQSANRSQPCRKVLSLQRISPRFEARLNRTNSYRYESLDAGFGCDRGVARAARFTVGARVKTQELVPFIMIESRH